MKEDFNKKEEERKNNTIKLNPMISFEYSRKRREEIKRKEKEIYTGIKNKDDDEER